MVDGDFGDDAYYDLGWGIRFNRFVELEVAYNNFGDVADNGVELTSFSYGANVGFAISEGSRLYLATGSERLDSDETV